MADIKTIGKNLSDYRKSMGITQEGIANYLGVKREIISYYENGTREIPLDRLIKITDLLGIELSQLVEEDNRSHETNLSLTFRADEINPIDFEIIANFKKIIKNYLRLKNLCAKYDC
ncbi:MAG: helix-turn-helix transcriptional regulator [Candidatus Marinimicrobia bacterium]|nr:helix-turn-helix transcriptional regulator [Candidatus Neomarinimicrobiota bacterium]